MSKDHNEFLNLLWKFIHTKETLQQLISVSERIVHVWTNFLTRNIISAFMIGHDRLFCLTSRKTRINAIVALPGIKFEKAFWSNCVYTHIKMRLYRWICALFYYLSSFSRRSWQKVNNNLEVKNIKFYKNWRI